MQLTSVFYDPDTGHVFNVSQGSVHPVPESYPGCLYLLTENLPEDFLEGLDKYRVEENQLVAKAKVTIEALSETGEVGSSVQVTVSEPVTLRVVSPSGQETILTVTDMIDLSLLEEGMYQIHVRDYATTYATPCTVVAT